MHILCFLLLFKANADQQCPIPPECSRKNVALSLQQLVFLIDYHEHSLTFLSNLPSVVCILDVSFTLHNRKGRPNAFRDVCVYVCVCVERERERMCVHELLLKMVWIRVQEK